MNNDPIYYIKDKLFSYNAYLMFLIGNRGGGKTFCAKFWCIDDFLKTGSRFVWVRRYNTELSGDKAKGIEGCVDSWGKKMLDYYPNHTIETKNGHIYIDDKDAGVFVALSTSIQCKSTDYLDVNKIVFDEFLIDSPVYTYLRNEVRVFLDLISSIQRPNAEKDKSCNFRIWCIANAISFANDYFYFFDIKPFHKRFYHDKERSIVVEIYRNELYNESVRRARFGKLVKGTSYEEYAIDNKFVLDSYDFIKKKPPSAIYWASIRYMKSEFGIYLDDCFIYVSKAVDRSRNFYVFTKSDHSLDSVMIKSVRGTQFEILLKHFQAGNIYYESIMIKKRFYDFVALFITK